jgi:phage I-like protein
MLLHAAALQAVMLAGTPVKPSLRTMVQVRLKKASALVAGGKTPAKEFRIFQYGENETSKGTFLFDEDSAALIMSAYRDQGNDLPVDYEHAMAYEDAAEEPSGDPIPAAGYFKLELRDDGLWATEVEWSASAAKMLADGEYKYFSPWFLANKDTKQIVVLKNVALVGRPASKHQTPIAASVRDHRTNITLSGDLSHDQTRTALYRALQSAFPDTYVSLCDIYDDHLIAEIRGRLFEVPYLIEGATAVLDAAAAVEVIRTYSPTPAATTAVVANEDTTMKTLLTTLGLAATVSESEAVAQVLASQTAQRAAESELLSMTGAKSRSEALGVIAGWKSAGEQVTILTAELAKRDGAARDHRVTELLAQGERDGKISPAMKPVLLTQGQKDPAFLEAFLATAPKILPTESKQPAGNTTTVVLSDIEKKVAEMQGVSLEQFAATKARLTGLTS